MGKQDEIWVAPLTHDVGFQITEWDGYFGGNEVHLCAGHSPGNGSLWALKCSSKANHIGCHTIDVPRCALFCVCALCLEAGKTLQQVSDD